MELTIVTKTEEPLLKRTHLTAEMQFEKQTPSHPDVASELSKKLGADQSLLAVKTIKGKFGQRIVAIDAYLYQQKEVFDFFEKKKEKKEKKKKESAQK